MTVGLYLSSDVLKCTAKVTIVGEHDGKMFVEFDQTPFAPKGGGQLCDIGEASGVPIIHVAKLDDRIIHFVAGKPDFTVGQEVELKVDAERRKSNQLYHSGGHAVAAVAEEQFPTLRAIGGHH